MSRRQRYVSRELTHFVGAKLANEEAQFELLLLIIRTGLLKTPGQSDVVVEAGERGPRTTVTRTSTVKHDFPMSSNEKYSASIVCLADIPADDLHLHMDKYSRFGLSFSKTFLLGAGANPVFYVARQSTSDVRNPLANDPMNWDEVARIAKTNRNRGHKENFTRAELFDAAEPPLVRLVETHMAEPPEDPEPPAEFGIVRDFLSDNFFQFVKFFDPELPDDDPDNYYMEREWRIIGPLKFELSNVERIFIPRAYRERLRQAFPSYDGQLSFADE